MKLFTVNLSSFTPGQPSIENVAPAAIRDVDHIITTVSWLNNDTVVSAWMNRVQNQAYLQSCVNAVCNMVQTINGLSIQNKIYLNFSSNL